MKALLKKIAIELLITAGYTVLLGLAIAVTTVLVSLDFHSLAALFIPSFFAGGLAMEFGDQVRKWK